MMRRVEVYLNLMRLVTTRHCVRLSTAAARCWPLPRFEVGAVFQHVRYLELGSCVEREIIAMFYIREATGAQAEG